MNQDDQALIERYLSFVPTTLSPPPEELVAAIMYRYLVPHPLLTKWQLAHLGFGLQGEALELIETESDFDEEVGDICWYLFNLIVILGIDQQAIFVCLTDTSGQKKLTIDQCLQSLEKLTNQIKKHVFYSQPNKLPDIVLETLNLVRVLYLTFNDRLFDIIISNETKLRKRYETGFSIQASIQRTDKT